MLSIVTTAQMQELDRRTIQEAGIPGLTLMENAGAGVVSAMERTFGPLAGKVITVVCGKGNNGGDGFVVARRCKGKGARSRVVLMARPSELRGDAKTNYQRFLKTGGRAAIRQIPEPDTLRGLLEDSDLVVDALLGTGLTVPVKEPYLAAVQAINESGRSVVSVDLPSGLHGDSGEILGEAVRARLTVTFGLPKLGLYVGQGIDQAGAIEVVDIGIPESLVLAVPSRIALTTPRDIRQWLPERPASSHKGTFGHVGVIAGSRGKSGAAALTAKAALRTGAGLVTVATPMSIQDALESKLLEVMTVPMPDTDASTFAYSALEELVAFANARSAVAIGPGLTTHPETVRLVHALIPRLERPCVLDADALNALGTELAALTHAKASLVLTPHPGEMARLVEGATPRSINADRVGSASRLATERHVVVILKGARTVIAHPDGHVALCPTGNPGMATAGSGDVLTGMVASLLAQGLDPWKSACAATYLHGVAGDLVAESVGQVGMTAGDLLEHIPAALRRLG